MTRRMRITDGGRHIPIVPGTSIFDLGVGDARIRPTADCGVGTTSIAMPDGLIVAALVAANLSAVRDRK